MSERLLFVTGKLAAPALRDTLGRADLPFDYDVAAAALYLTSPAAAFITGQAINVNGGTVM